MADSFCISGALRNALAKLTVLTQADVESYAANFAAMPNPRAALAEWIGAQPGAQGAADVMPEFDRALASCSRLPSGTKESGGNGVLMIALIAAWLMWFGRDRTYDPLPDSLRAK